MLRKEETIFGDESEPALRLLRRHSGNHFLAGTRGGRDLSTDGRRGEFGIAGVDGGKHACRYSLYLDHLLSVGPEGLSLDSFNGFQTRCRVDNSMGLAS